MKELYISETFECLKCGGNRIEEVMENTTLYSEVYSAHHENDWEYLDYGPQSTEYGEIVRFQCLECGEFVANSIEELTEKLETMKNDKENEE